MVDLELLLRSYGYWAVLVGSILEGETVLIVSGFLAQRHYLNLAIVILLAFLGNAVVDQALFFLGRYKGERWIASYPSVQAKVEKVHSFLERHENWIIFSFRFTYGFRTIGSLILGTTSIKARKFMLLNFLSALIWALIFGVGGFFLGSILQRYLQGLEQGELMVMGLMIIVAAAIHYIKKPESH